MAKYTRRSSGRQPDIAKSLWENPPIVERLDAVEFYISGYGYNYKLYTLAIFV
jgi:hypothetical protein